MTKWLLAGAALLFAGLLSYTAILSTKLATAEATIEAQVDELISVRAENKDLSAAINRRIGATKHYLDTINALTKTSNALSSIIRNYNSRETPDEKCLDYSPPSKLIDSLRNSGG